MIQPPAPDVDLDVTTAEVTEHLALAGVARRAASAAAHHLLLAAALADRPLRLPLTLAAAPRGAKRALTGAHPQIRLLESPVWGAALGGGRAFLQGRDETLLLRVVGVEPPQDLSLVVRRGERTQVFAVRSTAGRPFALALLNGGGKEGTLLAVYGADASALLGPEGAELELRDTARSYGTLHLPELTDDRLGYDGDDTAAALRRNLLKLLTAYRTGDHATWTRVLVGDHFDANFKFAPAGPSADSGLLVDLRGHRGSRVTGKSPWADLTLWHALWLRALLAEVLLGASKVDSAEGRRWGLPAAAQHPQLARAFL